MIVFPMAGQSRRFKEQHYAAPKFQLPLWDGTVFDYAVSSFSSAFSNQSFLFIYRETGEVKRFVESRARALGIENFIMVQLDQVTAGQAETVALGIDRAGLADSEALTIFNIDTFRKPGAEPTGLPSESAGWLEVFQGSGSNWSFVKPASEAGIAAATAEKIAISDLCCTGLYHFESVDIFRQALTQERQYPTGKELYVAPLYNHLIQDGRRIGYGVVDVKDIFFCGIPEEYEMLNRIPAPYRLGA